MSILSVKNISKVYDMGEVKVNALRDASFDIEEGEIIVVLGPSGSGKSTLLNLIGGMDKVSSGEIFYRNMSLHDADEKKLTLYRRNAIGFIFQFYNLMPNLTAYENVEISSEISNNPLDVDEIIKSVGLEERVKNFPAQMSGGEQQRVSIARAIVKNPDILLCDEPTGALDINTGKQVIKLLCDVNEKYNKTLIIITHNASIAGIADRVLYIKDGTVEKIEKNKKRLSIDQIKW